MAFGLCPLLTHGGIEALDAHGTDELKNIYLAKLVSGEWTGTMQLTEPQAGSDVGALRTRAERAPDGSYRIKGTKIFITYGDHDMGDHQQLGLAACFSMDEYDRDIIKKHERTRRDKEDDRTRHMRTGSS